jgi:hypothetical protein
MASTQGLCRWADGDVLDGERDRMCQWDFDVGEPVPAPLSRSSVADEVDAVAQGAASGNSLRMLAREYGVSHGSIRRAIARALA